MTTALIIILASIFPVVFLFEDLEGGGGIYDPGTGQPTPRSLWDRLQDWHKNRHR